MKCRSHVRARKSCRKNWPDRPLLQNLLFHFHHEVVQMGVQGPLDTGCIASLEGVQEPPEVIEVAEEFSAQTGILEC